MDIVKMGLMLGKISKIKRPRESDARKQMPISLVLFKKALAACPQPWHQVRLQCIFLLPLVLRLSIGSLDRIKFPGAVRTYLAYLSEIPCTVAPRIQHLTQRRLR